MLREWGKVRPFVHIQNARVGFPFSLYRLPRWGALCAHNNDKTRLSRCSTVLPFTEHARADAFLTDNGSPALPAQRAAAAAAEQEEAEHGGQPAGREGSLHPQKSLQVSESESQ